MCAGLLWDAGRDCASLQSVLPSLSPGRLSKDPYKPLRQGTSRWTKACKSCQTRQEPWSGCLVVLVPLLISTPYLDVDLSSGDHHGGPAVSSSRILPWITFIFLAILSPLRKGSLRTSLLPLP